MPSRASSGRRPSTGTSSASGKRSRQHPAGGAEPVDEPQLGCAGTGPHLAGEQVDVRVQTVAAPRHHPLAEHLVQLVLQAAQPLDVLGLLREERVEPRLGLAGGVEPPLARRTAASAPPARSPGSPRRSSRRSTSGARRSRRPRRRASTRRRPRRPRRTRAPAPCARRRGRGCGRRRARTAWASRPASSPAGRRRRRAPRVNARSRTFSVLTELITDRGTGPAAADHAVQPDERDHRATVVAETTGQAPGRRAASRSGRRSASMCRTLRGAVDGPDAASHPDARPELRHPQGDLHARADVRCRRPGRSRRRRPSASGRRRCRGRRARRRGGRRRGLP